MLIISANSAKPRRKKQLETEYIFISKESKEKTADKVANILIEALVKKGIKF